MDLVNKSRWKEIFVWVLTSGIYLKIDQLLFLIALVQTNRMLKYYKQLDQMARLENERRGGRGGTQVKPQGTLFLMKQYFKILIFRCMRIWPSMLFCIFGFPALIFYLGHGSAWTEYYGLFEDCEKYWWSPLIFMNDIIPFYKKDMQGCMRWTAFFAIEMKLFLVLPIIAYLYHRKWYVTAIGFCLVLSSIGLVVYGLVLQYYRISPGYLHIIDFQSIDLIRFKLWSHIDSYFLGITMAFAYETIKHIRFATKRDRKKKSWTLSLMEFFVNAPTSTFVLINFAAFSLWISMLLHFHIDISGVR